MQNKLENYIEKQEEMLPIAGFIPKKLKALALKQKRKDKITWDQFLEASIKISLGIPPEKKL